MMVLDMDDLTVDENPATLAYALLVLMSAISDVVYESRTDIIGNEMVSIVTTEDGIEMAQILVSPAMGDLLIAILEQVGEEIAQGVVGFGTH